MADEALWSTPTWRSVAFIDRRRHRLACLFLRFSAYLMCPQLRVGNWKALVLDPEPEPDPFTSWKCLGLLEVPEGLGGFFRDAGMTSLFTQDAVPFTVRLFCEVQS